MVSSFVLLLISSAKVRRKVDTPYRHITDKTTRNVDSCLASVLLAPLSSASGLSRSQPGQSLLTLIVEELAWCLPRCVLEHAGKMLRVFKAQFASHLVDGLATENKILGTPDNEVAYVVLRALAKGIAYDVAKVVGRQAELAGTVFHAGQSVTLLHALCEIVGQHLLEATEDVAALSGYLLVLTPIEAVAIVEDKQDVVADNVGMPECLRLRLQFLAQVRHELAQSVFFLRSQYECFVRVVGEELIAVEFLLDGRPLDERAVEQQHPAVILPARAVIALAAYLPRGEGYQRPVALMVGADTVSQALRKLLLHEDTIAAGAVQRVTYLTRLVVVYHRDVGMQHRRADIPCVVVGFVDIQVYCHNRRKGNNAISR